MLVLGYRALVAGTRLGVCLPVSAVGRPALVPELAAVAESAGVESIWLAQDPSAGPAAGDPIVVAGTLAAWTTRCTVGVLVDLSAGQAPSVIAKELTALDVLSAGRAALGLGWGSWWNVAGGRSASRMPEGGRRTILREALPEGGAPVGTTVVASGLRGVAEWVEEAATVCRGMWTQPTFSFEGRHISVTDAVNHPVPVHAGGIPLLLRLPGRRGAARTAHRVGATLVAAGSDDVVRRTVAEVGTMGTDQPDVTVWRSWSEGMPAEALADSLRQVGSPGQVGPPGQVGSPRQVGPPGQVGIASPVPFVVAIPWAAGSVGGTGELPVLAAIDELAIAVAGAAR